MTTKPTNAPTTAWNSVIVAPSFCHVFFRPMANRAHNIVVATCRALALCRGATFRFPTNPSASPYG